MRKFAIALLVIVAGCGTFRLPLTGLAWNPNDPHVNAPKRERFAISPASPQVVGDTFHLTAMFAEPDTAKPRLRCVSSDPSVLFVGLDDCKAVFLTSGRAKACLSVWYFYMGDPEVSWTIVRNSSNKPTCKNFSTREK